MCCHNSTLSVIDDLQQKLMAGTTSVEAHRPPLKASKCICLLELIFT